VRRRPDQATGDDWCGGELSPSDGGRWCHDPRWRLKEWSSSCKNRGKRSVTSRRNSMHEESRNGGQSQRLAGGKHCGGLPHIQEKMGRRRRKLRPSTSFIGGRREVSEQRSRASAMTRRRQTGLVGTWHGEAVPCLGRLRMLRGRFKPTRATVQRGQTQYFTQKLFHLFKLALTCILQNQILLCSKFYPTLQECSLNCNEYLSF
jgi:hypothetical protein